MVSRLATRFWGLFASIVAIWAAELGSLIEVVNRFGSFFYGSILGVFILAIGFKRANSTGAFVGMLAGMTVIVSVATYTKIAFLWHNLIGAAVVVSVGLVVSALTSKPGSATAHSGTAKWARLHPRRDPRRDLPDGRVLDARRIPAPTQGQ